MSNRLNQDRELELQPKRMQRAKDEILNLGLSITLETDVSISFTHNGHVITFYPYSGWHTGKTIKDGRGLNNLLKQLK